MSNSGFPYSVGIAQSPVYNDNTVSSQMAVKDQEEQRSKATKILPYPLDIHQSLGDIYVLMSNIRNKVEQARQTPNVDPKKLDLINNKLLDANQILIIEIPEILATLEM